MCDFFLAQIQDTIQDHDLICEVKAEAEGVAAQDAEFHLELAFDYYKKTCTLTRFDFIFG